MRKTLVLLMYCNFIITLSCKTEEDVVFSKLKGDWAIYDMSYKGQNYKDGLYVNTLFIDKNKIITLPESIDFPEEETKEWTLERFNKKNVILNLNCKNKFFRGKYHVYFFKNKEKRLLGVNLKSETTNIIAYKFLQDFNIDGIGWE